MLLDMLPGVVYDPAKLRNTGYWREVNLVRWEGNSLVPVGGWVQLDYPTFPSPIRAIHRWTTLDGNTFTAYLCEAHCFVDIGEELIDISPTVPIQPPLFGDFAYGGYGDSLYGDITYGTPRAAFPRKAPFTPTYSIDNWGEDLLVMTSSDGRLLRWQPSEEDGILTIVPNAPDANRSFVVTPERHVVLFGADGDSALIAWSDEEDAEDWTYASTTSRAGFITVEPRSPVVATYKSSNGTVVFTNREIGVLQAVGLPFVYGYVRRGEAQAPYSAQSIVEIPQGTVWPSPGGFWLFNGVNVAPFPCPAWWWVEEYIDFTLSRYNSAAFNNSSQSEFWWFFTSKDSETGYNDRYVMFNYQFNWWSMGRLGRTCGMAYPNDANPLMASRFAVFSHENGIGLEGAPELPWAETHNINAGGGSNLLTIMQMQPELEEGCSNLVFRVAKINNPTTTAEVMSAAKPIRDNGFVDVRETTRNLRIRVEASCGQRWKLGQVLTNLIRRGTK
jgi:hypothetical protein